MIQKSKESEIERKKKLRALVRSIMEPLTTNPSFDLRSNDPPLLDRRRSAGGYRLREDE